MPAFIPVLWALGGLALGVGAGGFLAGEGAKRAGDGVATGAGGVSRASFMVGAATIAILALKK